MANETDPGVREYIKTLNRRQFDPLTKKEEHKLLRKYKKYGDTNARDKLINSNLRYAFSLANVYAGRGLSYPELLSEANDGLIESIDKFDTKFDIKLFSYSKWWIKQRITVAIENRKKIPTAELPDENESVVDNLPYDDFFEEKNIESRQYSPSETNTDDFEDNKTVINTLFKVLTERESDMLNRYFGIDYEKSYTLKEIGDFYNISKVRVRKIIEGALKKVRCEAILMGE